MSEQKEKWIFEIIEYYFFHYQMPHMIFRIISLKYQTYLYNAVE